MIGLLVALVGAYGVFLLYTALVLGWRGVGLGPGLSPRRRSRRRLGEWLAQAGLGEVSPAEFFAVVGVLAGLGGAAGLAVFGGPFPALALAAFAGSAPVASFRGRRRRRLERAREAWPRMIEEIRLLAGSLGRSVPQALFEVGRRGPEELRPAFAAAHREWLLSVDFARTLAVLKGRLADATADAACETLLVAHEVGGSDLDRRLTALAEDRAADLQGRKDAWAAQAGARFARRFVLLVPFGMAGLGLTIGNGRQAYQTGGGQAAVLVGIALVVACWLWSGRMMRLPEEERVFHE